MNNEKMTFAHIVAADFNRVIGVNGRLPWRQSSDLKHFKKLTLGHTLLMGRKTFESLPASLSDRFIVVITRNERLLGEESKYPNVSYAASIQEGITLAASIESDRNPDAKRIVYIAGGAEIYAQTMSIVSQIVYTTVCTKVDRLANDVAYYPPVPSDEWKVVSSTNIFSRSSKDQYDYMFSMLRRKPRV